MVTEDFVSFETAKLLKEKGFNEPTYYDYDEEEKRWFQEVLVCHNSEGGIACPTLQMAMKWLRDIHGLFIHIDVIREASCWTADIQDIKNDVAVYPVKEEFPGYEEACEAAIKYCLENLI